MKAFINWSGGKDAAFALHLHRQQSAVGCLLTNVSSSTGRITMHGVRRELLEAQAASIGLPLHTIALPEQPGMDEYEQRVLKKYAALHAESYRQAVFGDIFLEDLKHYRQQQLAKVGLTGVFPLWGVDTRVLLQQFLAAGFQGIVVSVNSLFLDQSFCGRLLDEQFLNDLPPGVDPCGENGEFHTFVFDGPIFQQPVRFSVGEVVERLYTAPQTTDPQATQASEYRFYFCDLLPQY